MRHSNSASRNSPAVDLDPVKWFVFLRRVGTEDLFGLRGIVIVPKPHQSLGQLSAPIRRMMAGVSECEPVIVSLDLQRIGKIDILERPASPLILVIFRAIAHPNANISLLLPAHPRWKEMSGFWFVIAKCDAGERAVFGGNSRELVRPPPAG